MKSVSISGSLRENVGKKDAKQIRNNGGVPCVVYGGKEQLCFVVENTQFKPLVYTPDTNLVKLNISGKEFDAILQDMQFHPVTDEIIHADFLQIFPDKAVKLDVPVKVVGNSPGVIKGGKLTIKMRKLKVKALPAHMPDTIEINISELDIAQSIKVENLKIENLEFLDPAVNVIVTVKPTRASAGTPEAGK